MDSLGWYKFQPDPEDLVSLLKKRRLDPSFTDPRIKEIHLYEYHPSELRELSQSGYFLSTLEKKYGKGELVRRTAKGGFWKITGSDRDIKAKHSGKKIGTKKILVYYKGFNNKKENRTNWVMHEIHESHPNKDPKDKLVVCHIERKREKKRGLSSAPDGGEPSDNLAYDPQNNVAEDILEVESQPLQDHHLPSGFNNDFASNSLLEVGSQLLPNSYVSHVTKNDFQELESQLLPNQHISSNGDLAVKNISSELDSQLLPNQYMYPIIGDHAAKTIYSENESQLLPNRHLSSTVENHAGKGILSEFEPQPLQDHHLPSSFNNDVVNDSILEFEYQSLLLNYHMFCTTEDQTTNNSFSENESQLLPNQHSSSDVENDAGKGILSEIQPQVPTQGDELTHFSRMDHNSFSTLQSPEFSYSTNFDNDLTPWLESLSAVQSSVYPPPGSSYSTSFTNNLTDWQLNHNSLSALPSLIRPQPGSCYSNVWAFAAELEDDAPYLNSSEAVAGGYVGNGTGSITAWPNEQFPLTNGEYPFNNTFVNQGYVQY